MRPYEIIFRNSFGRIYLLILNFLLVSFLAVITIAGNPALFIDIIAGTAWAGVAFLTVQSLFNYARSVNVTNEEITVQKLFGTKSLRWDEITSVSRRGEYLCFHNRDGKVTLSIGSQMNEYAELVELFFKKQPKLFKTVGEGTLLRAKYNHLFISVFILLFLGAGFYSFHESEWSFGILFVGCGIYALFNWPRIPQNITLLDDMLLVTYLFRETPYYARWIDELTLEETESWGQASQFVKINLKMGKPINLSVFPHNGLLAYRSLKRWHKKATTNQPAISF